MRTSTNHEQYPEFSESFMEPQESYLAECSSPLLPRPSASTRVDKRFSALLLTILPLALHFLGSLAVAFTLLYYLDGRQFYLERQPQVRLADGTLQSQRLGRYSLLQPEVTTLLSVWLMVLRWVAAMWAVPLCWRVLFVLAGRHGVRYQDISWATNYGILYPSSHFQRSANLLLGLILVFTLAPQPSAPLLTGSVSWLPSNKPIDLPDRPTLTIPAYPFNPNANLSQDPDYLYSDSAIQSFTVANLDTAWTQDAEPSTFKQVIPSISQLSIGSTVDSVLLPYFTITRIKWIPKFDYSELSPFANINMLGMGQGIYANSVMASLIRASQTVILLSRGATGSDLAEGLTWSILINVGLGTPPSGSGDNYCNSETTFLPANSTVPSFYADFSDGLFVDDVTGCFAFANISINAGHGLCSNCRVSSYSTVQNDTELQKMPYHKAIQLSIEGMRGMVPLMAPLRDNLPDPALSLDVYITALLTRLYSALWTSWINGLPDIDEFRSTTGYKPSVQVLRAEINHTRVYAWLCSQLLLTLAGVAFIGLQSRSQYPLVGDADMIAFDIDTTEVTKPGPSSKGKLQEGLRIEPKGDGWKVVAANDIPKM